MREGKREKEEKPEENQDGVLRTMDGVLGRQAPWGGHSVLFSACLRTWHSSLCVKLVPRMNQTV